MHRFEILTIEAAPKSNWSLTNSVLFLKERKMPQRMLKVTQLPRKRNKLVSLKTVCLLRSSELLTGVPHMCG